jgi:predicted MFS family arabinose efflux permease
MVDPADLPRANGHLSSAEWSGEQFAGPAIGGLAFAVARWVPFVADAVSFLGATVLVRDALPDNLTEPAQRSFGQDVRFGLQWFARHRMLRLLALVIASMAFCQAMVLSELALYGTHQLHLSRAAYGLFFAAISSGNVVGALLASRVHAALGPTPCIVIAAFVSGGSYVALGAAVTLAVAVPVLFLEGVAVAVGNVTIVSLRQQVVPNELLGRVGSSFRMLIFGMVPVGALAGGLVASGTGVPDAFVIAGALQLAVLVLTARRLVTRIREHEQSAAIRASTT